MGLFDRLKAGLTRTAQQFTAQFEALVQRADTPEQRTRAVDVDTLEALEELLIMADIGVEATDEIVEARACASWSNRKSGASSRRRRSLSPTARSPTSC
jgi:signal recognition particle GTPase